MNTFYEDYQKKILNINDFVRCSCTCNVNDINNIKVCFWKQTIYFDTCLNPKRTVCRLERLYISSGYFF